MEIYRGKNKWPATRKIMINHHFLAEFDFFIANFLSRLIVRIRGYQRNMEKVWRKMGKDGEVIPGYSNHKGSSYSDRLNERVWKNPVRKG